jgi:hypothetical protein
MKATEFLCSIRNTLEKLISDVIIAADAHISAQHRQDDALVDFLG